MPRRPVKTVTVESVWTWIYRAVWLIGIVVGACWFTFQLYSDVGTLKTEVHGLFEGQKTTHQLLSTLVDQTKK